MLALGDYLLFYGGAAITILAPWWIVKIGGSLNTNPNLPAWLNLFTQCGGGRVTVVSKGKEQPFCNEANESCWQQNRRGHFVITGK